MTDSVGPTLYADISISTQNDMMTRGLSNDRVSSEVHQGSRIALKENRLLKTMETFDGLKAVGSKSLSIQAKKREKNKHPLIAYAMKANRRRDKENA